MKKKILSILVLLLICSTTMFAERQTIVVTESGLPYRSQVCFTGKDVRNINEQISEYYDLNYDITSVSYTSNNWLVVMSTNSGLGTQTLKIISSWPKDWIREQRSNGYYITSLASNGPLWFVVLSENPRFSAQTYKLGTWDKLEPWISERRREHYDITEAAYNGDQWMVVMTQTNYIANQRYSLFSGDVKRKIQEKSWGEGYSIQLLNYGGGQYFLVASQYLKNNDRQQTYCIQTDYNDFVHSEGNDSRLIAYAGGGLDQRDDQSGSTMSVLASRFGELPREKHLPALTWLNTESVSYQKNYTLNVGVKSSSKVEDIKLYVNGDFDQMAAPVTSDGYDMKISRNLTLDPGTNTIKLIVSNADGESVLEREIVYTPKNVPSP